MSVTIIGAPAEGQGVGQSPTPAPPPKKIKQNEIKKNVFGEKVDAIWAKINHTNFICA